MSKHSNNTSGQYSMYVPLAIHMYVSINLYPKYACKQLLYIQQTSYFNLPNIIYADAYIDLKAVKHIYLSNMQSVAKPINTTCISNN